METKNQLNSSNFKVCSFDTNVLLRWLLQDDIKQAELVENILQNKLLKKIYISDLVLIEAVWVMESVYKLDRQWVCEALEIVMEYPKFVVNKGLFQRASLLYPQNNSLSFADCVISLYSDQNNFSPLLTFDQKLAKKLPNAELIS